MTDTSWYGRQTYTIGDVVENGHHVSHMVNGKDWTNDVSDSLIDQTSEKTNLG